MWRRSINRRVHPVWCVAWFCIGTIMGIALSATTVGKTFSAVEIFILAILCLSIAFLKRRRLFVVFALLAGLLIGIWRGGAELAALTVYQPYYGKTILLQGNVSEDVSYGPQGDQRIRLRSATVDGTRLPGVIWISVSGNHDIKRGDILIVIGQLSQGFGNVPAAMHQADIVEIVEPQPGDVARQVRDWFANGIRKAIPEPEASLSVGYLVGQRSALPETLADQLKIVGLTHAVVASGYNLTILVGFTRRLLARYSKYLATLVAASMIICFVLITGLSPSMSRAGLVSLLSLIAWYYGRSLHPVVLLAFAASLTAVWRPSYVWGDIGWYLSFTSFIGVIVLAPLLQNYFWGSHTKVGMVRQTLLDTIAAQTLTMPIILFSFGQYATYALLANILVLPFVPLAMLLSFFAGLGGLVIPGVALWFGMPAKLILGFNTRMIQWVAHLPGSHGEIVFGIGLLIACYSILFMSMVYLWKVTHYNFRKQDEKDITVF